MFDPDPEPLHLEILVVPEATLILTAAVLEPLRGANRILGRRQYGWTLSSPDGRDVPTTSGVPIPVGGAFDPEANDWPLLVVASYNTRRYMSRDLIRRISAARRRRPVIGGVESGVFLLAEAGLLDGRPATCHWEDVDAFELRYPDVLLRNERFVIDGNRFSAGGAGPALDLMLELIRRRQGYPLALDVSRLFIYDPGRTGEDAAATSLGRMISADPRVARAVQVMEAHLEDPIAIDDVARLCDISARHLQTLFRRVLGVAPKDYYLALRLNLARRRIIETSETMSDIASATGFSGLSVFTRAYTIRHGESPMATRRAARG